MMHRTVYVPSTLVLMPVPMLMLLSNPRMNGRTIQPWMKLSGVEGLYTKNSARRRSHGPCAFHFRISVFLGRFVRLPLPDVLCGTK